MKRFLIGLLLAGVLFATPAIAGLMGGTTKVLDADGTASIGVNADEIIYTGSFPISSSNVFGVWLKAVSATGTPAIKVELEESYTLPTTEGAGDANWVEPDGFSDVFSSIADEIAHVKYLSPDPMPYARFKITGGGANPADTVVTIYRFSQGDK